MNDPIQEPTRNQVFAQDSQAVLAAPDERLFLRDVFSWMFLGLATTTGIAVWFGTSTPIKDYFAAHGLAFLVLFIVQFAMVIGLSLTIHKMSPALARVVFLVYAALTGALFSVLLSYYSTASIAMAFAGASGVFAGMALWGWTTKRSLAGAGPVLFGALIGLIVANLVYMFTGGAVFNLILGILGVIIFAGLTAWDMQKIKEMGSELPADGENAQRYAIIGALALYLDFINLFLSLLRIFGGRD